MKIIGFEEHYMLPAIAEANPNSPLKLFDVMKIGRFGDTDPQAGWPAGITDLGEGRIVSAVHEVYRLRGTGEYAYARDRRIELTVRDRRIVRYEMHIVG